MNAAIWVPVVVALIAAIPGILAYRQALAAARATANNVRMDIEAKAYERARLLYEQGLQELERQIANLREQLAMEQDASNRLRNQINELEETVARLRRQMALSGIIPEKV